MPLRVVSGHVTQSKQLVGTQKRWSGSENQGGRVSEFPLRLKYYKEFGTLWYWAHMTEHVSELEKAILAR